MTYPNLTDADLQRMKEAITQTVSNAKSDIRKRKLKIFERTLLSSLIIIGGVAVAIVFPSPVVIAALGGAVTLIAGNNGVTSQLRNIKKKSADRSKNKEEAKNLDVEQKNREWIAYLRSLQNTKWYSIIYH